MRPILTILFATVLGGTASGPQAHAAQSTPVPAQQADAVVGGHLHGVVKSGATPLPGVVVTAQNTLTGKRVATLTDLKGQWSLTLAQNGRYVVRTQFAGFAAGALEAVLNATSHEQTLNFDVTLASRATTQEAKQQASETASDASASGVLALQQMAANGAQSLSLSSTASASVETQGSAANAGAALPSIAQSSDFSSDTVAINGQSGTVSAMAGMDMDHMHDAMDGMRAVGGLFGGGPGGPGGGFGGFGGGFGGPGGPGGRGNFRNFNSGQPHGAIFWTGTNSAVNAQPYSLNGESLQQPANGSNRFGITFMSAPYLPGLTKPSGKDTFFLSISGSRSSSPSALYATVPTDAERTGDLSTLPQLYDQSNNYATIVGNQITLSDPAKKLLQFFPTANLTNNANGYNYERLTTSQSNSTQIGARYMRSFGKNVKQTRRSPSQGLRQSMSLNYNWSGSASDSVNLVPELGGKNSSQSQSLQAGYSVSYHKLSSNTNLNWNRSLSQARNYFTNSVDIASQMGIYGPNNAPLNSNPINYGLPSLQITSFTGLSDTQPSYSLSQTISFSQTLGWIHGKHNMRFGGDYRRVHRDSLGGSNATGGFTFTGKFTEDAAGDSNTGSALADFLLGLPQQTTLNVASAKTYLRDNVTDVYAQDDWRARPSLTLNFGVRYEYFAPYTETNHHLAFLDTNPVANTSYTSAFQLLDEVQAGGQGTYLGHVSDSLVTPFRTGFAPRLGAAYRWKNHAVIRAGYGMNYTMGQYGSFASSMARQPMPNDPSFVNQQTNTASYAGQFTLAQGFVASTVTNGNYALDPHYRLPYVQVWNLDVQRTLPWGVVLNAGYNGSRGSRLDIRSAPRASASSPGTDPSNLVFYWEQAAASSRFHAGTLRVNKRMSSGLALGASYRYSHSIDNAGALGGTSTVVAQNWQNLNAEESNSGFDQRHRVDGNYLYELPFGKDKRWLTAGAASHIFEGFSISGTFSFATGQPLTPNYQGSSEDVSRGTAGTLRPNRDYTQSLTSGGGSALHWFNTAAFTAPASGAFGNASRNSIPGPGSVQNNMSLAKTISLQNTASMEFRATATNVFNTVQYAGVGTSLDTANFGKVTSVSGMRQFQFNARFRF